MVALLSAAESAARKSHLGRKVPELNDPNIRERLLAL